MKVSVNDVELFTLSDIQKQVICNDINSQQLDADLQRRLHWVIMHKYEQCFERLKKKWDLKFKNNGIKQVPTDPDEYAALVFAQPNYKDRLAREVDAGV